MRRNRYRVGCSNEQFETIADAKWWLMNHKEVFNDHEGGHRKLQKIYRGLTLYGTYMLFGNHLVEVDKGDWRQPVWKQK